MLIHSSLKKHQGQFAVFGLLFGAICWGVIWYPYRIMQEAGISGVASSFYTYVVAVSIFSIIFLKQWRAAKNHYCVSDRCWLDEPKLCFSH